MRTVLRYVDGRAIWSENTPSSPESFQLRGSLVVGGPGRNDASRTRKYALAGMRKNLQNQGVKSTIPEVLP